MKIREYTPTFIDKRVGTHEFNSMEELLNLEFIKRKTDNEKFYQFSVTKDNTLMVEYSLGREWWVVGFFEGDISTLNLQEWVPVES